MDTTEIPTPQPGCDGDPLASITQRWSDLLGCTKSMCALMRAFNSSIDIGYAPMGLGEQVWAELTTLSNLVDAARISITPAIVASGRWKTEGSRTPEEWMANKTGSSTGKARSQLETGKNLRNAPGTQESFLNGEISAEQADTIADAVETNPAAEDDLLDQAKRDSLKNLKDEANRRKAEVEDVEERERRLHRTRYVRQWTDQEGAWNLRARGPLPTGSEFMAVLEGLIDQQFKKARKAGVRGTRDNYAYDALMDLANQHGWGTSSGSGDNAGPDSGGGADGDSGSGGGTGRGTGSRGGDGIAAARKRPGGSGSTVGGNSTASGNSSSDRSDGGGAHGRTADGTPKPSGDSGTASGNGTAGGDKSSDRPDGGGAHGRTADGTPKPSGDAETAIGNRATGDDETRLRSGDKPRCGEPDRPARAEPAPRYSASGDSSLSGSAPGMPEGVASAAGRPPSGGHPPGDRATDSQRPDSPASDRPTAGHPGRNEPTLDGSTQNVSPGDGTAGQGPRARAMSGPDTDASRGVRDLSEQTGSDGGREPRWLHPQVEQPELFEPDIDAGVVGGSSAVNHRLASSGERGRPGIQRPPKQPKATERIFCVDWNALVRGRTRLGERCELRGLGAVSVTEMRRMLLVSSARLVVTADDDRVVTVALLGTGAINGRIVPLSDRSLASDGRTAAADVNPGGTRSEAGSRVRGLELLPFAGQGVARAREQLTETGANPRATRGTVIIRVRSTDLGMLDRTAGGAVEIPGLGFVDRGRATALLGAEALTRLVERGVAVRQQVHPGRGPSTAQRIALAWADTTCKVPGCTNQRVEVDHRDPWATQRVTELDNLDPLCSHHHGLKSNQGWAFTGTDGSAFESPSRRSGRGR